MSSENTQKVEPQAKVIPFPRHRIVRWPKAMSKEMIEHGLEDVIRRLTKIWKSVARG